jgi:hypothetical protein
MTDSATQGAVYGNWKELKAEAPGTSALCADFVNFRTAAIALGGGEPLALIDKEVRLCVANLTVGGGGEPAPELQEPDESTPEVEPEPDLQEPDQTLPTEPEEPVTETKLAAEETTTKKRRRARCEGGKFVADDPNTPENEAWVEE